MEKDAILAQLASASAGLLFPSETDAPFAPFALPPGADIPSALAQAAGRPGEPQSTQALDAFFRPAVTPRDWHGPEERRTLRQFQHLLEAIRATLPDATVYRVGESGTIDIFILGKADDAAHVGLQTQVVQT